MTSSNPSKDDYLSRSALAEKLGISLKELTQLMISAGWINQEGKRWHLTAKGEFEGGIYRDSKKYGQYIVWPGSVVDHPMIREMNEGLVTATVLAKQADIPARLLNRLLAELGWIEAFAKGWEPTALGLRHGGAQSQDEETGIHYVMWPRHLLETTALSHSLSCFSADRGLESLNGVTTASTAHSLIASWLYVADLSYSYKRERILSKESRLIPDFYLPQHQIYIDYWPESLSADALALQLSKREMAKNYSIHYIEISHEGLLDLDHELSRELMQLGVTVY